MANLTNKSIEFLSNRELENILLSVLREIDIVASSGAHRSTTYLAVAAIECLLKSLINIHIKLGNIQRGGAGWPINDDGNPLSLRRFSMANQVEVLKMAGAIPEEFEKVYAPLKGYRNYIHIERELKQLKSGKREISQSIGQFAIAALNAIIEGSEDKRFLASQEWRVMYGLALVPEDRVVHMPPKPGEHKSLLITHKMARNFKAANFRVIIPPGTIFNFVYSYHSMNDFRAARIEGRPGSRSGLLICNQWEAWTMADQYTTQSEPDTESHEHWIEIRTDSPNTFSMSVDGHILELSTQHSWNYDPEGQIGFLTELGGVSIIDLDILPAQLSQLAQDDSLQKHRQRRKYPDAAQENQPPITND